MYNSVWQVKVQKNSYSQLLFIYFVGQLYWHTWYVSGTQQALIIEHHDVQQKFVMS